LNNTLIELKQVEHPNVSHFLQHTNASWHPVWETQTWRHRFTHTLSKKWNNFGFDFDYPQSLYNLIQISTIHKVNPPIRRLTTCNRAR